MIPKDLGQIKEEDLQALRENSVPEGKTIEYKQTLPSDLAKAKKEFLADVSSFANADGGDLIYGIVEDRETGTPKSLDGLNIENVDQEISRLDNMIRTSIQPRIPSVRIQPVPLKNSRVALIIRVPKSWISPHRVIYDKHDKFYTRSSNGKYPLDVNELRIAFNLSDTITDRIRNFRLDRISELIANETPTPFNEGAKIVLQLIPITSFNPVQSYDIDKIFSNKELISPIACYGYSYRYNIDGFLTFCEDANKKSYSYVQSFRKGMIEAVNGSMLEPYKEELKIPSVGYEEELIKYLASYLSFLQKLNVEPPIFVFLTLLGVKGYSMAVSGRFPFAEHHTIDRDILQLPEAIIENYDVRAQDVLRPCFDSIWNACGFQRDFNYNDANEWAPKG